MNPRNKFTLRGLKKNFNLQVYQLSVAGEVLENRASEREAIKLCDETREESRSILL